MDETTRICHLHRPTALYLDSYDACCFSHSRVSLEGVDRGMCHQGEIESILLSKESSNKLRTIVHFDRRKPASRGGEMLPGRVALTYFAEKLSPFLFFPLTFFHHPVEFSLSSISSHLVRL